MAFIVKKKIKGRDYFYLRGGREYFNMNVLLPDTNPKIDFRRHIKTWEGIKNSPEIKLLSFMANFLSNGYLLRPPPATEINEECEGEKSPILKELEDVLPWEKPHPRHFPDGKPIDPYQSLSILNKYTLGELFSIFEPELIGEEYCDEDSTFKNNPYALCALVSSIVRENERTLPNNEAYFRKSYPVDWKKFTSRKRKPTDDRGSVTQKIFGEKVH